MILEGEHKTDVRHYVVVHSLIINFICRLSVINILYFKPGFFRGSKYCTAMQKQDSEYYLMPRLGSCAVPNRGTHAMASLLRGVGRKQRKNVCVSVGRQRLISRDCPTLSWDLANPVSARKSSKMQILERADIVAQAERANGNNFLCT